VRFFTRVAEVDLCGHAKIPTFSLLFHLKKNSVGEILLRDESWCFDIDITDSDNVIMTQSEHLLAKRMV
jgi:predicted PhzF superfamily epimerase YddE/YHI9